jgi:hypothetical protein
MQMALHEFWALIIGYYSNLSLLSHEQRQRQKLLHRDFVFEVQNFKSLAVNVAPSDIIIDESSSQNLRIDDSGN